MKKFETFQVHMAATGKPVERGQLFLHENGTLHVAEFGEEGMSENVAQELFVLSKEEIKIEDKRFWFFDLGRESYSSIPYFCDIGVTENFILTKDINFPTPATCRRIVASTDKSFAKKLSHLRDNFKSVYAEAFNDRKPIVEIDLEIVPIISTFGSTKAEFKDNEKVSRYDIKTRKDGSVILRPTRMFSLSEVLNLTFGTAMAGYANGSIKIDKIQVLIKEWQDENVK